MFNSTKSQITAIIVLVLTLAGILTFGFVQAGSIEEENPINSNTATKSIESVIQNEEKVKNKEPFIVALFGTDERGNEASRTDTIMLVRYDMENKKANIVSIPRDTKANIEGHGIDKINAAHAYGEIPLAVETIENLMDIEIDYYAKVNFEGFKDAIEIIAPLEVDVKKTLSYEGVTVKKGLQKLNAEELLTYVRFRKDTDGDFGRINRQQEVIKLIAKEMMSPKNILKLPSMLGVFREHVDTNLDWNELITLAKQAKNFSEIQITSDTLKTHSEKTNGIWYENADKEDLRLKSNLLNGIEEEIIEKEELLESKNEEYLEENTSDDYSNGEYSSLNFN